MNNQFLITESEELQNCYAAISSFFACRSLSSAKNYLHKLVRAAMDTKATKLNPSNVLYFYKSLGEMLAATLQIQGSGSRRQAAIIQPNEERIPDLTKYEQYFGWHQGASIWSFAPRSLSAKEYGNPYKVFKKLLVFANSEKWMFILNELQDYTFYKSSFAECSGEYNILSLHLLLQKLLEASHLIDVRAIMEVDGQPRPKWKSQQQTNEPS